MAIDSRALPFKDKREAKQRLICKHPCLHAVSVSDFEIDGKTFEVGGRKKGKKQIEDVPDGFVVKDDIEYVHDNQVPLWMFGFLY